MANESGQQLAPSDVGLAATGHLFTLLVTGVSGRNSVVALVHRETSTHKAEHENGDHDVPVDHERACLKYPSEAEFRFTCNRSSGYWDLVASAIGTSGSGRTDDHTSMADGCPTLSARKDSHLARVAGTWTRVGIGGCRRLDFGELEPAPPAKEVVRLILSSTSRTNHFG